MIMQRYISGSWIMDNGGFFSILKSFLPFWLNHERTILLPISVDILNITYYIYIKFQISLWNPVFNASCAEYFFYRSVRGVILMYDVGEIETLQRLHLWLKEATDFGTSENAQYFFVGNKCDLSTELIEVDMEKAVIFAEEFGIPKDRVIMISAKTGDGVDEMFRCIARAVSSTTTAQPNNIKLEISPVTEANKCNC